MMENEFEKIRNLLSPIYFLLETMKYGARSVENEPLLNTAFDSMEDIKDLLNQLERKFKK